MTKGAGDVVLDQALDQSSCRRVLFGCSAMIDQVERGRLGIIAFEADFARTNRSWCWRHLRRHWLLAAYDAVPEGLLGIEQFKLVEPVARNLDDFVLVIAENHREDRSRNPGHRHV